MATVLYPLRLIQSLFNRLLPFTTPGTPLLHDIIHTLILCTVLYFGPSIQQHIQRRFLAFTNGTSSSQNPTDETLYNQNNTRQDNINHPPTVIDHQQINHPDAEVEFQDEEGEDSDLDSDRLDEPDPILHQPPPHPNDQPGEAGPGPANPPPHQPRPRDLNQRNVGAKKAKSLARREQRRAYHEFQRSRGDAQRAEDNKDAEERDAALFEEKRRRAVAEMEIEERRRMEAEAKREAERRSREEGMRRREGCVRMVREGLDRGWRVNLKDVARAVGYVDWDVDGEEWAGRLVRGSGMVGTRRKGEEKSMIMVTGTGYVVKVGQADMDEAYRQALEEVGGEGGRGRVDYKEFGGILEQVMEAQTISASR